MEAYYVRVVEDLYCLQNMVFHISPQLTYRAARSLCDGWATC